MRAQYTDAAYREQVCAFISRAPRYTAAMAQPPLLTLKDIHLTFVSTPLLEGAELAIMAGERVCLVGRNGSGKSTLLKIAAGMIEPDQGERFFQPGTTVRYLPQEPDLSAYATVRDYVIDGLEGADDEYRVPYLLDALGLTGEETTDILSGGEARRAALARALAPQPDILMLDEPTNHLDLPAIEWLEDELKSLRSAIVLISHDRRFLENLTRKTVWMDRGQSRVLNKGFAHFEDWRDEFLENEEMEQHKLGRQIAREQHWIVHGVSGRRKRNVRRVKELAGLRQQKSDFRAAQGGVNITVTEGRNSGKSVVKMDHVYKAYDRPIVSDLTLKINRGDRLGIIGPNGGGKTTLLKLIMGQIEPDKGDVKLGVNLEPLVLDQKRETLDPSWTLKDALTDGGGDKVEVGGESKHVIGYMKDFLFLPEQARTPVHALSGGERGRLGLARGLRTPSNLLVLDEPTNDLDLETLDLLQEMIADYKGTVLVVSHDRDFLDRVSTSVLALEPESDGRWIEYPGGYSDMVRQRGTGVQARKTASQAKAAKKAAPATAAPRPKGKLTFKDKHALETLPGEIAALQDKIAALETQLTDGDFYERDPNGFNRVVNDLGKAQDQLSAMEDQWLELEMLQEELSS